MKNKWKDGWQAPLTALVLVALFSAFKYKHLDTAADVAAWVQGIGSLLAIVAAIAIYTRQAADKEADDNAETRAFVQALYDEITTIWIGYSQGLRPRVLALKDGDFLDVFVPMNADALVIYNNGAARIGKVDDASLRSLTVMLYARMRGFIYSIQFNSALLNDLTQFDIAYRGDDKKDRIDRKIEVMVGYAAQIRTHDGQIAPLVDQFKAAAEQWLAAYPAR